MNKSTYGFKQAAENWYEELANVLIEQNFVFSKNDYSLFSEKEKGIKFFVVSCVDDLVVAGNSIETIEELKKTLEQKLKMDDRGKLEWFLGMQINENTE